MASLNIIDNTRIRSRKKIVSPSGIDRVIEAYSNWLALLDAPLLNVYHSFGGLSMGKSRRLSFSRLSTVVHKFKKQQFLSKCINLVDEDYHKLQKLDVSNHQAQFRVERELAAKADSSEMVFYFSIGHDVLTRHSYLEWLGGVPGMKKVFFIHDTIPLDYPEYCRHEESGKHKLRVYNAHLYGDLLIVNSQYTADRLEYWRGFWNLEKVPVHVLNIGVEVTETADEKVIDSSDPYFVMLGTIEPRKNHLLLLNVWRSIIADAMSEAEVPKLLIIGRMGWEVEMVERLLERNAELRKYVEFRHDVADADLWPVLKGARALLFPSFVEGWGMPVVEALHHGVPAICSDIQSLREASASLADYCSPINGEAWKSLILDYTTDSSSMRHGQIGRIKNFKAPTWEEHFSKLELILKDL